LQKDCDCLRLATSDVFIIYLYLSAAADMTTNMLP